MIIPINDNWRLTSDRLNYILQRKRKHEWRAEAYHNSLPELISTLLERDFRSGGTESLTMALKRNQKLIREVSVALSALYAIDIHPLNPAQDEVLESVMIPGVQYDTGNGIQDE